MSYNFEPSDTKFYIRCIKERIDEKRLEILKYQKELYRIKPSPIILLHYKRYYQLFLRNLERCEKYVNEPTITYDCLKVIDNQLVQGLNPEPISI